MPFAIIQAGSALQMLASDGTLTTLDLPETVSLRSDVPPRWAIDGRYVILVNTPSQALTIGPDGVVRPLSPRAPRIGPILSAATAGALSGTYAAQYTFVIKDALGNVIAESGFSPVGNTVTFTSKKLRAANLDISPDTISARRLYRTTTGPGGTYFGWIELDGNVLTQIEDDLSDAGLQINAAPTLGNPPRLTLIAEWRSRLWGVGDVDIDTLLYCEAGSRWAWPSANAISIPHVGSDDRGIIALVPRRDALGVGRRNRIMQVVGTSTQNFNTVILKEKCGVLSQETVQVWNDVAYWLWEDGVYEWSDLGVNNIADGRVRKWFTSDDYFNRGRFRYAYATVDPIRKKYRLYLAAAGSAVENRWIEFDITERTWWGPHQTDEFGPASTFVLPDVNDTLRALVGSREGDIYQDDETSALDGASPVAFDIITKAMHGNTPRLLKHWGQLSVLGKVQNEGTLTITPYVGGVDAPAGIPFTYDMRIGQERQPRLGDGNFAKLRMQSSARVDLYGIELPKHVIGWRK
jgi:hypothetical protein